MIQALKVFLITISVIVVLVVGVGTGIIYGKQALKPSLVKAERLANDLKSKVISSITATGKITNIAGRTLTITKDNDSLPIIVKSNAVIFESITQKDKTGKIINSTQQNIEFKDLKTGFLVGVSVKLLPGGQLEGQSVVIFSK